MCAARRTRQWLQEQVADTGNGHSKRMPVIPIPVPPSYDRHVPRHQCAIKPKRRRRAQGIQRANQGSTMRRRRPLHRNAIRPPNAIVVPKRRRVLRRCRGASHIRNRVSQPSTSQQSSSYRCDVTTRARRHGVRGIPNQAERTHCEFRAGGPYHRSRSTRHNLLPPTSRIHCPRV